MTGLSSISFFDVVTVTGFVGLVGVFLTRRDQSLRVLLLYLGFGAALAVANQIGNHGYALMAAALIAATAVFAISQTVRAA